jgi:hypothetical protein
VAKASSIQPLKSAEVARQIFLGQTRSIDGQRLTVILQQPGVVTNDFDSAVMKEDPNKLTIDQTSLIFSGAISPPKSATDSDGVKALVLLIPGGIGYVGDDSVDSTVKVIYRY